MDDTLRLWAAGFGKGGILHGTGQVADIITDIKFKKLCIELPEHNLLNSCTDTFVVVKKKDRSLISTKSLVISHLSNPLTELIRTFL